MKAKRLLSAFVAVAMMVTMLVSFSSVTYAEDKATMNISFVELTESEIEELEASFEDPVVLVPEGTTPYWLMITISDYGTLSSKSTGAGTKLMSFSAKFKFDSQATDYIDKEATSEYWWALDMGEIGSAVFGISELQTDGVPGTTGVVTWAGGATGKTCWPTGTENGRDDEILLCQIPIAVKKGFTATVTEGIYGIKTFTSNSAFSSEANYYGSEGQVNIQDTVTCGTPGPDPDPTPAVGSTVSSETGVANIDNAYKVTVNITNPTAASSAGIEFVPKAVYDKTVWADAATAEFNAAKLGQGTTEFVAALMGIPVEFAGKTIKMYARAYVVGTAGKVYGSTSEQDIIFNI